MIVLVGFMGSGKSTVGRRLAERLGLPFVDLDDDIEALTGQRIADVFAQDGEEAFRQFETEALQARVVRAEPIVLALGGGAYAMERNRELVREKGRTVWLDIPFERALARVSGSTHRPLAQDPVRFAALFEARRPLYGLADVAVRVESDDAEHTARLIMEALA